MNEKLIRIFEKINPWTNVYGLARTLLATSTLLTLIMNDISTLFKPTSDFADYPSCGVDYSLFCIFDLGDTGLGILKWLCIILLLLTASGWRPRITGIIHAWITFSFYHSAVTVDGGEQVTTVFTLILIPLTLTDNRKWHWQDPPKDKTNLSKAVGISTYFAFRIQVAILYFHSVVAKISQEEWIDGTAVWYYMQSPMLGIHPKIFEIIEPILGSPLVVIPTWGTLIVQTILFASLFMDKKHWRKVLILAILMHELFAIILGLVTFSIAVIGVLLLYLWPLDDTFKFKGVKNLSSGLNKINILKTRRT
ncbi:hypothetical protein H0266_13100 [Halobacillus locisalis]|uniref:HTTM-like domain-containing protein n=1 Tax=Halobacillus locisalis TaxID=220753 RepID=A0A838CV82_9BACI|nr:sporulation-delaying protein SdpB family protein [Halobacillus locisalis]MBA2175828.1 hypothetical protein [Halobacillus locisalis]